MADIRIKDLTTTAAASSADDYIAVDGTSNGTRKLSAATPSFATSVTVPSVVGPTSTDLTLTGGSTGASLVLGQGTTAGAFTLTPTGTGSLTVNLSGSGSLTNSTWNSGGAAGVGFDFKRTTATATLGGALASINAYNGTTRAAILEFNGDAATDSGRFDWWVKPTGGGLTQVMTLKSTGNLLIGTTTDAASLSGGLVINGSGAGAAASSTTTGALRVTGGVGVSGGIYAGAASVFGGEVKITDLAQVSGSFPQIIVNNSGEVADARRWQFISIGGALYLRSTNDADSSSSVGLSMTRTGANVTAVQLGNSAAPITAPGTGAHTFGTTNTVTMTSGALATTGAATFGAVVVKKNYTVATLPAAASWTYGEAYVSDATQAAGTSLGSAPTGGGSVKRGVYSDGSSWLLR